MKTNLSVERSTPTTTPKPRLRVALVGEYGWQNGGENSWLAIAPELIRSGVAYSAVLPAESEFAASVSGLGLPVVDFNVFSHDVRKSQVEIRHELAETLSSLAPDLIHANSLSTARLIGPVARQLGIPSLGYLRDIIRLSKQAVQDVNQNERLIAVSQATRDSHVAQGIHEAKTVVINNGIDSPTANLEKRDLLNELGLPAQARLVSCVGQIGIRKGLDTSLRCFLNLAERLEELHCLVIGKRHSQKEESRRFELDLRTMVSESPYGARVHWLGRRSDARQLIAASELLLHGARQEPFGRVLLEAAAAGTPFIATNVGGTSEIAGTTSTKILVPPDDPDQMARAAWEVLTDERIQQKLSDELQSRCQERFSIAQCASSLLQQYLDLSR